MKLIQQAKLVDEDQHQVFVPFEENNIDMAYFKTKTEARLAIARVLGKPLATLPEQLRQGIDQFIDESLHKATVLLNVREFFKLKLVSNQV